MLHCLRSLRQFMLTAPEKTIFGVSPMRRLIIPLMLFLAGSPVLAQDLPWNELVRDHSRSWLTYRPAVVADPADLSGESWYAFTPTYLWHTEDMGATVQEMSKEGLENLIFSGLAVAHDAPDILYLATGINQYHGGGHAHDPSRETSRFEGDGVYQSRDRGETWQRLPFFAGVPDGRDLHVLKGITSSALGDTVLVTTTHRILLSVDAGQTWSVAYDLPRLPDFPGVHSDHSVGHARIYHHPRSLRHLFVTVGPSTPNHSPSHSYVLVSHNGAENWDFLQVDEHPPTQTPGQTLTWLFAADPKDPNVFWAQVANTAYNIQRKIFRSGDGGQSWVEAPVVRGQISHWAGPNRAHSIHVHPQGGDTLVLGWSIGHYQDGRLITEGIQGGVPVHYLAPGPNTYDRLRYVEDNPGERRGVAHAWMVAWTVDESFAADVIRTGELPLTLYFGDVCTSHVPAGADDADRYLTVGKGTYSGWRVQQREVQGHRTAPSAPTRSGHDLPLAPGQTLKYFPDLSETLTHSRIHCHPDRYDILSGGNSSWGGTDDGRTYGARRSHPDSVFRRIESDDPVIFNSQYQQFSFSRSRPDRVWMVSRGQLYWSDDYTTTWTWVPQKIFEIGNPGFRTVHAHDADADVIYTDWAVTKDGGETWARREIPDAVRIQSWDRVVSDLDSPAVIYACSSASGLRKWGNYLQIHKIIAEADQYGACRDLFVFRNDPERMWMGTDTGLWETLDAGETWSRQNRGLPNVPITRINLSHDWEEILVATFGRGLFTVPATAVDMTLVSTTPGTELPESSALLTNFPNPFVGETSLQFRTMEPANVRLELFDVLGRRVAIVTDQVYGSGMHRVRWNGTAMPSGVYFVRMEANGRQVGVQKLVRR